MESYDDMTHDELLDLATERGVDVKKSWTKAQLIDSLTASTDTETLTGVVDPPDEGSDDAERSSDDAERRSELVRRATALGIHVPDSWSVEKIDSVLTDIGEAVVADPPPEQEPASPRG